MKKIAVVFMLVATHFVSQAQNYESKYLYTTKEFKDASPKKITVTTSHGNISVSESPASQTRVEVYVHGNYNGQDLTKDEIQRKLDEYYSMEISLSGDVLNASVREKKELPFIQSGLSISFNVYAPKNASSTLKTDHGNIDLSGLTGNQEVVTSHGNLDLDRITGKLTGRTSHGNVSTTDCSNDVDVSTDHGNIMAKNCSGTIKLLTSSGNLDLSNLKGKVHAGTEHGNVSANIIVGDLTASTTHGDVRLDAISGSVDASTDHGNISLKMEEIKGHVVLGNVNGNISIELSKGKGLDLDLRGRRVTVDGMQNFSGSQSKDLVKGSTNGGGIKVSAKTDKEVSLTFR